MSIGCKKEDEFICKVENCITFPKRTECEFEQNDEDLDGLVDSGELEVMTECFDNRIRDEQSIRNNLIGHWQLVGFGAFWESYQSMPCAFISFTEEELYYQFDNGKEVIDTTLQWHIETREFSSELYFMLKTGPDYIRGLSISNFCKDFIFYDHTPGDGEMYLFQKVI